MYKFLVVIFLCVSAQIFGQSSDKYNSEYATFYRAEELFAKKQYGAARFEFRTFINQFNKKEDPLYQKALYYEGLSALELFNNDAVALLISFNQNYPESVFKNAVYFRLGQFYYQKKEYAEALIWLNQLKAHDVEKEDVQEYYFKLGYSNFQELKFEEAKKAFFEIKDGESQYSAPALYYYSHIAYQNKMYQVALDGLLKLQTNERFSKVVPYYIVQIYHLQGRYDEVVKFAPSALDTSNLVNSNDMNHLVGDAYYRLKKYDEAVPYLLEYNKKTKTTRSDDYELGFSYFKAGMYPEGIRMLDKVTTIKDSLGQVSYYHIGESYLKQNKLSPARAAFEEASKIKVDLKVQEDALYNYAILSYKLDANPYDEAVEALQFYLKQYPNSTRKDDVYQYLVSVYTTTNNYSKALQSLDNIPNKNLRLKSAYQLVAYNRGVELYLKNEFANSILAFDKVEVYPIDPVISGKAKFWSSDCHFKLNKYEKAIQGYRAFLALPNTLSPLLKNDAYYNIGYAYFAKHDTLLGVESFRIYTQQNNLRDTKQLADAFMRIADGSFATRQNENAIKYYLEAIKLKVGNEDRALFYLAKAYSVTESKPVNQIECLQNLVNNYPNSKFILEAIESLAVTYKGDGQYDKAKRYFEQIIADYPTNILVVEAKIAIADIYFKKKDFVKAELSYKQLLIENGSEEVVCKECALGLIAIYAAQNQPEKVIEVNSQYPCAGLSKNQEEDLFYNPAKLCYDDTLKSITNTIELFEKYLAKYPAGINSNDARFYLANCYIKTKNIEKAIPLYIKTLEEPNDLFTIPAAQQVSKYLFNNDKYAEAIPYYIRLEEFSKTPGIINNSRIGLMRSYYLTENWENSVKYSKLILSNSNNDPKIQLEATHLNAVANINLKNYTDAKISLEWLTKNTTTVLGAEAKYLLAEMYFELKEYEKSDSEIKALIKMKPSYFYWVAKGLILQTNILMIKDDLFNAEETINSVIEHYPNKTDGIIDEATAVWNELMQLKNVEKEIPVKSPSEIEVIEEKQ